MNNLPLYPHSHKNVVIERMKKFLIMDKSTMFNFNICMQCHRFPGRAGYFPFYADDERWREGDYTPSTPLYPAPPFAGQKNWPTAFATLPLHNSEGDIQLDLTDAQTKSKMVDIGINLGKRNPRIWQFTLKHHGRMLGSSLQAVSISPSLFSGYSDIQRVTCSSLGRTNKSYRIDIRPQK